MLFSGETTLNDLLNVFDGTALISGSGYGTEEKLCSSLNMLHEENPTWGIGDMLFGLERLYEIKNKTADYVFPVYSEPERRSAKDKADVTLFALPAQHKTRKEFALLLAGGAYGAVCTLSESLPVASRLNELGFDAFCLNYRTATPDSFITGLMPKPLDDVASALRLICNLFPGIYNGYILGGFSAGAHLASLWGTKHIGACRFSMPQPKMLILAYPLFSLLSPSEPIKQLLIHGLFGEKGTQEDAKRYCAAYSMDEEYPPTYIVRAEDDPTVPVQDTQFLIRALENAHIGYRYESAPSGGHGFGLGSETPLSGWVERAIDFFGTISR